MGLDDSETVRCILDELFFFLYKFSFGLLTYTTIYINIPWQLGISSNTSKAITNTTDLTFF